MTSELDTPIRATRGIRYARAERFEASELVPYTPGAELGVAGPMSPQTPGMLEQLLGMDVANTSEDCLFLDVFAPESAHDAPVLVWIHGGAYLNGSGSVQWYDGSRLAARGVVVVSINYRLGALGFLGDGNWGTLDQICALRWVQRHVSGFGGDPGNVTIFGESAGGSAVISLMASPDARGLFHRVWSMSPSIRQLRDLESANRWRTEFLAAAEVDSLDDARVLPLERVLAAQSKVIAMPSANYDMFSPAAGGAALPDDLLATAAANPVPLCVGTNRDENLLFLAFDPNLAGAPIEKWYEHAAAQFGETAGAARAAYEAARPGASPVQLIAAAQTDHVFRRPAQKLCEARAAHGTPSWMYWFTWASPAFGGMLGSAHALDIPFAFDNLGQPGTEMLVGEAAAAQPLATRFADEIVGYASSGTASWTSFHPSTRATLRLDVDSEELRDPEPELRVLHH